MNNIVTYVLVFVTLFAFNILKTLVFVLIAFIFHSVIQAATHSYTFRPSSGKVKLEKEFNINVSFSNQYRFSRKHQIKC